MQGLFIVVIVIYVQFDFMAMVDEIGFLQIAVEFMQILSPFQ